jgi:hypothetical protein
MVPTERTLEITMTILRPISLSSNASLIAQRSAPIRLGVSGAGIVHVAWWAHARRDMIYSLPLFEVKKENPIETDVALWHRDSYRCGGMSAILVLGGGVIGLSMAMMLARQGRTGFVQFAIVAQRALSKGYSLFSRRHGGHWLHENPQQVVRRRLI